MGKWANGNSSESLCESGAHKLRVFFKYLGQLATLSALALATGAFAQQKPESLEPLPTDPEKRIYYGEHYSPEQYAKCWEKWGNTGDIRLLSCDVYKERLEPFDPARRESFGEFYDPKKYHECRHKYEERETRCEYLRLRRHEPLERWPYADVPRPEWPEAPNPPVYRWWMSAKQYFDALCKSEAGEFIRKTVKDVEGVYRIRGRWTASAYALRDRYVMEEPYGYTVAAAQSPATMFVGPKKYRYLEVPGDPRFYPDKGHAYLRFFGFDNRDFKSLKREYDSKLKSLYGFTWRGIKRPKDREHGIAGGELIVVDLATNEILAIRRGFILAGKSRYGESGMTWEYGQFCPLLSKRVGIGKEHNASFDFVSRVLGPAQ